MNWYKAIFRRRIMRTQKRHYKERRLPETAEGWDNLLLRKYGCGLWPFVHSFAGQLFTFVPDYFKISYFEINGEPQSLRLGKMTAGDMHHEVTWKLEKSRKLERHIIEDLAKDKKDEKSIPKRYGTQTLFHQLHVDQAVFARLRPISRPAFYGRGRPIKFVCRIAFVWSEVMKNHRGRSWFDALGLFKWMRERLKTLGFVPWKYLSLPERFYTDRLAQEFVIYRKARNDKSEQKRRAKVLQEYRSSYFPVGDNGGHFRIAFTSENIIFDMTFEDGRIEFPDRTFFQENPYLDPVLVLPRRMTQGYAEPSKSPSAKPRSLKIPRSGLTNIFGNSRKD